MRPAYTDRDTAASLILKLFPELVEGNGREVAAPYIKLTLFQSDEVVAPGSRFTVTAEVALPRGHACVCSRELKATNQSN